jgi:elongation factor G
MRLEVLCPEGDLGDVLGELTLMRGHVKRIESRGALRVVAADAPLAEMNRRGDDLSLRGEAATTMHFAHYERLSFELADAHAAAN